MERNTAYVVALILLLVIGAALLVANRTGTMTTPNATTSQPSRDGGSTGSGSGASGTTAPKTPVAPPPPPPPAPSAPPK